VQKSNRKTDARETTFRMNKQFLEEEEEKESSKYNFEKVDKEEQEKKLSLYNQKLLRNLEEKSMYQSMYSIKKPLIDSQSPTKSTRSPYL